MKKSFHLVLCLLFAIFVALSFISCPQVVNIYSGDPQNPDTQQNPDTPQNPEQQGVRANQFFWGTWVRMDNGLEYEVLETSVQQSRNKYDIIASDDNTLTVDSLGKFCKQSDSVIVCDNIPYFRNGGVNLEYSLRLVGFTSQTSRAVGTGMQGIKGRATATKYKNFESNSESNSEGNITFTAPTANDPQTVTITYGNDTVIIPGLTIANSGDYMGTVALVDKDDYNLKITGTISDYQKDHGYLYGNNAKTYDMELTITNISKNECSTSACTIESDDVNLIIRPTDDTDLTGFTISTLVGGATKRVNLSVAYGELDEPYVDTGISVTIKNPFTNQEWKDYIPLRFFKGTIPITIAAKNPENNNNAALNGFVIYPDGNNQFFAIPHNSCKPIFVPTFGNAKPYMLVFSGATVTSQLDESTEMYYTVEPASLNLRNVITSGSNILEYIPFGGDNHSEDNAFSVTEGFEAYLRQGEIDYYKIIADSDTFYGPGGSTFYSISYENEMGEVPSTVLAAAGAVLNTKHLPELTCDGYEFLGWYSNGYKITPDTYYYVYDNINLKAKWQLKNYSIQYNLNGGTAYTSNPTLYNLESSEITLQEPERTGYEFRGWYETEDFSGEEITEIKADFKRDITLYAKWDLAVYTISYYLYCEDDEVTFEHENPSTYTMESETIYLSEPSRTGYNFTGWYSTDFGYTSLVQQISKGSSGNRTIYATWSLKYYSIQYNLNGATKSTSNPIWYNIENSDITLQKPERTGYEFKGWYETEDFSSDEITEIKADFQRDITLYAKWELKPYKITYVTNGGKKNTQNPTSYTIEDEISLYDATYSGFSFAGWFSDSNLTRKITKIPKGTTGDITLYARWGENGNVTISLPEYSDIEINYTRNGNYITFTAPENFYSYEWQIDGSKMQSSDNIITVNVSRWSCGRHTIMLIAKDGNSTYKREATVYLIIE